MIYTKESLHKHYTVVSDTGAIVNSKELKNGAFVVFFGEIFYASNAQFFRGSEFTQISPNKELVNKNVEICEEYLKAFQIDYVLDKHFLDAKDNDIPNNFSLTTIPYNPTLKIYFLIYCNKIDRNVLSNTFKYKFNFKPRFEALMNPVVQVKHQRLFIKKR